MFDPRPATRDPRRLFLTALVIRLLFSLSIGFFASDEKGGPFNYPDEDSYKAYARSLRKEGRFADGPLRANRPPGYPLFLASCEGLLGTSRWAHALPQAALGGLSCLLVLRLGKNLGLARAAPLAAWAFAFWPHHVAYTPLALTETLFTFLFLAFLAAATDPARSRSAPWAAGLAAAAAALTRPGFFLLPPALLAAAALARLLPLRAAAAILALYAAGLAPWAVRNRIVLDRWIPLSTRLGHDLYESVGPDASGAAQAERILWPADLRHLDEAEKDAALRGRALHYMADHPARTLYLAAVKFLRTWNPLPNDSRHRRGYIAAALGATAAPLLALAAFALLRAPPPAAQAAWLLLPVAYLAALQCLFLGSIRYRLPAEPLLLLLAFSPLDGRRSPVVDRRSPLSPSP